MSLRAELVRLGLRRFVKRRDRPDATVAQMRQSRAGAERFIPSPPAGTETIAVDAGGVPAVRVTARASQRDRHVLYLHGGGFVTGSSSLYRHLTWRLAAAARARLLSVDYRLAPEHPFPAALEDAVAAYRWLLADGADARQIAVMGDSAGGALAFAMLLKLRDEGLPLPAAAVGLSPWVDLSQEPVARAQRRVRPYAECGRGAKARRILSPGCRSARALCVSRIWRSSRAASYPHPGGER